MISPCSYVNPIIVTTYLDGRELVAQVAVDDGDAAQARMETHWADLRREAAAQERRELLRKRQKALCPPILTALVALLMVGAHVVPTTDPSSRTVFQGCCDTPQSFDMGVAAQQGFWTVVLSCNEICEADACDTNLLSFADSARVPIDPSRLQENDAPKLLGAPSGAWSSTHRDACCCCGGGSPPRNLSLIHILTLPTKA